MWFLREVTWTDNPELKLLLLQPQLQLFVCGGNDGKGELTPRNQGLECILDTAIAELWRVANLWEIPIFRALYKVIMREYQYFKQEKELALS